MFLDVDRRPAEDEIKPGVILDYDAEGNRMSIEILDVSQHVTDADKMEFQVTS